MPSKLTPLMAQYHELKQKYKDGILFFQVGDFYETFYENAREVSKILNIALTSRDKLNPVPLAGVPIHAIDAYVAKLLQAGKKVIICDQVEDVSESKGLVKRAVTDVITPGTTLSPATLSEKNDNYIFSLKENGDRFGFALLSLSTGEFSVGEEGIGTIENVLAVSNIREAICSSNSVNLRDIISKNSPGCSFEDIEPYYFNTNTARDVLLNHFKTENLAPFGIEKKQTAIAAAGALLSYVKDLRQNELNHITGIKIFDSGESLILDKQTVRNLELFKPLMGDSADSTLIKHIDYTLTAAGGRMLRSWIMRPLRKIKSIQTRLDAVNALYSAQIILRELREALKGFPDVERIVSRISTGKAGPRELLQLLTALERLPELSDISGKLKVDYLTGPSKILSKQLWIKDVVATGIREDCPANLREGGVIKKGFDKELDKLIKRSEEGKRWIASLQESERKSTGIASLKVGFNKVFGYYIGISKIHIAKVPDYYIEKQTLVSSKRYVTKELTEKEGFVLSAEAKRVEHEKKIYEDICKRITEASAALQKIAHGVSILDSISSFAHLALKQDYCRPEVNNSNNLVIKDGRHPVVEIISKKGFIPNDIILRPSRRQVLIVTGPNMGGKSTIIRQTAIISILAHAGSFVPASVAEVGIMDRIFTRVGSSDNLAGGESTFLVEMSETAKILHNCTSKSLVLLDEVGRGTSTSDGLSIAQAVTEFLLEEEKKKPKTLFATHYHELTSLSDRYPKLCNMKVSIKEWNDEIIFLYKLIEGKSDKSYGIHVAQLAGLPEKVIERARSILQSLQWTSVTLPEREFPRRVQPTLFSVKDSIYETLEECDIDRITPIEAIQILSKLKKMAEKN